MYLRNYTVTFKIQSTLHIKTIPSTNGEEGAAALIMTPYNCPRTAITSIQKQKASL